MAISGPQLTVSPISPTGVINFGPVLISDPYTFGINVSNTGNQTLTLALNIVPVVGNAGDFSFSSSVPTSLAPGASQLILIEFSPTSVAGTTETATLSINSNSVGGNVEYTLEGYVAAPTDDFVRLVQLDEDNNQLNPVVAFGLIQAGEAQVSGNLQVQNRTSSNQDVTLTALIASGYEVVNQTGTNPLTPGSFLQFNLQLTAAANKVNQDDLDAIVASVAGQPSYITTDFEATYSTASITPVFVLTDNVEAMLLAFFNNAGQVAVLQADPLDLTCEEDAFAVRQYQLGDPFTVQQLSRLLVRYERLGPTTVTVTYESQLVGGDGTTQDPVVVSRTLSTATDGLLKSILFDGSIAGDIVSIQFDVAADSGPFSMTLFGPYTEPRGEDIEAT